MTFTEPVKLDVDPDLRGKKRRQAAGAALYDMMSNLIFRTTPTDRTVFEAFAAAAAQLTAGRASILEDPLSGKLTYKRALIAIAVLGAQARGADAARRACRRAPAQRQRRRRHRPRPPVDRPRAGDAELHGGRSQHGGGLQGGRGPHDTRLARLRREGPPAGGRRTAGDNREDRLARGRQGAASGLARQARRRSCDAAAGAPPCPPTSRP